MLFDALRLEHCTRYRHPHFAMAIEIQIDCHRHECWYLFQEHLKTERLMVCSAQIDHGKLGLIPSMCALEMDNCRQNCNYYALGVDQTNIDWYVREHVADEVHLYLRIVYHTVME